MVLIVFMLSVFAILAAITIDYSYMQLLRTEMRAATDAAAKAGAESLSRTQDIEAAKAEAVRYASANSVGGVPMRIANTDVQIGRVSPSGGGTWAFDAAGFPPNAVRVDARSGSGRIQPAYNLFFGRVLGQGTFAPSSLATAGQQDVEVCLCLDRSGSMQWDMSGTDWVYPGNNPKLSTFTAWGPLWQNYVSPPHPVHSRWAALVRAVNLFLDQAGKLATPPRTALVTWGSEYSLPAPPYGYYPASSIDIPMPAVGSFIWANNAASIRKSISDRAEVPISGGTNLSAGLDRAVSLLRGAGTSPFSNKVVILLTDGEWNEGRHPVDAAKAAKAAGITVHCISLLTKQQVDLQRVAEITGGRYYGTQSESQLRTAFDELARALPVVLTE
jgi:Ca-activated chloride channel homolog